MWRVSVVRVVKLPRSLLGFFAELGTWVSLSRETGLVAMACGRRCGQGARFNACVRIEPYVHPVDDETEGAAAASAVAPPPLPLALVVGVVEVVGLVGIRDPEAAVWWLLRRGIELPAAGGFTPLATVGPEVQNQTFFSDYILGF